MGRKILQRKLTKSKEEEKQKEVSDSIVVSQTIKEKLDKVSENLKVKIESQEKKYNVITEEVINITQEREEIKELYNISKDKLIKSNKKLEGFENQEKQTSKNIELLIEEYNNKNKDLINNYESNKNNYLDELSKLEEKIIQAKNSNEHYLIENKELKRQGVELKKEIDNNNLILSDLKIRKDGVKIENTSLLEKNTIISEEVEIIIQVLKDIEVDKMSKLNELNKIKDELSNVKKNLENSEKELLKNRETNVKLVKKEENLNTRATHIESVYEKAGIKLKL